jgi:hypothetical protein
MLNISQRIYANRHVTIHDFEFVHSIEDTANERMLEHIEYTNAMIMLFRIDVARNRVDTQETCRILQSIAEIQT